MKKRLSKYTKIVIGAIAILIVMIFVFNSGITGNPIARWIHPTSTISVPSSEDKGIDSPEIAPTEGKPVEPVGSNIALKIKGTVCTSAGDVYRAGQNYGCNNAIDGNSNTFWSISAGGKYDDYPKNTWIKLDLARETWINKIVLKSINIKAIGWIKKGTLTLYDSTGNKVETISDITVPYGRSVPTGITIPILPKKIKSARLDVIQTWGPNAGLIEFEIYVTSIPKCIDGTIHGQCSKNKPKYCENENLIDNCQKCGCPSEYKCSKNNGCEYSKNTCIDSNSYDPYTKGTTIGYKGGDTLILKTFIDFCIIDDPKLKDYKTSYICDKEGYVFEAKTQCINGCNDGACIGTPPQCADTDVTSEYPDGKNYGIKGTTTGGDWGKKIISTNPLVYENILVQKTYTDNCNTAGTALYEKYCAFGMVASIGDTIPCPCEDGRCKCYDTDEGNKIYKKGKISDGINSFEDTCISNTKIKEYYCDGAQISSKELSCEISCENGECVRPNLCKELIPGHNNLNEQRMNFVFLGLNYKDTAIFKKVVEMLVDYKGEYYGFYSLEPFKSNKNKINFWYVDKIETVSKTNSYDKEKKDAITDLLEYCKVKNRKYMALMNYGINPSSTLMGIPIGDMSAEDLDKYKESQLRFLVLFVHEMGHHFLGFGDDYVWVSSSDPSSGGAPPSGWKSRGNCFIGTKEECMSPANTLWYDLIGDGCGVDNVIDCEKGDSNYNAEVGCFEGCDHFSKGTFRSTMATLMNYCSELGSGFNCAYTYGLPAERRICNKLKELTGNVGGYCTSKFGIS